MARSWSQSCHAASLGDMFGEIGKARMRRELPRREEEGGAADWEERNINTILLVHVLETVALSRTNMPSGPSVSLHQSLVKNYIKKCAVRFC